MSIKKPKIYIAERIHTNTPTVPVSSRMSAEEVVLAYTKMTVHYEQYTHNGHWVLRGPPIDGQFPKNNIPKSVTPKHIWDMCRSKIESSDAFIAVISKESYGVVAEAGYAIGLGKPTFILFADEQDERLKKEMWFILYMSLSTKERWRDDYFLIPKLIEHGISSASSYEKYVNDVIPAFLV